MARGPFEQTVVDDGKTRVRDRYVISAPLAGRVERITLDAGDTVRQGQAVALLENTVTTGASTLEALDAVVAEGGKVARVLCLVDRGEGAASAFAERGIALEALFGRADLPV